MKIYMVFKSKVLHSQVQNTVRDRRDSQHLCNSVISIHYVVRVHTSFLKIITLIVTINFASDQKETRKMDNLDLFCFVLFRISWEHQQPFKKLT